MMKTWIVISCILANGQHIEPRGSYQRWTTCDKKVEYFETILFPSYGNKHPLCWCWGWKDLAPDKVKDQAQ